mmetsp:Transcript_65076/g.95290  ORF Transcript_65076/g.95290 Transcript_65076/m.95290 type:complete len:125 (+) Transcript_65076:1657-2031(+)
MKHDSFVLAIVSRVGKDYHVRDCTLAQISSGAQEHVSKEVCKLNTSQTHNSADSKGYVFVLRHPRLIEFIVCVSIQWTRWWIKCTCSVFNTHERADRAGSRAGLVKSPLESFVCVSSYHAWWIK